MDGNTYPCWDLRQSLLQGSHKQASKNFNDYSMIFQDKNSQISMIILNVTKRKITGPHVTHGLLTHLMFIIGCF